MVNIAPPVDRVPAAGPTRIRDPTGDVLPDYSVAPHRDLADGAKGPDETIEDAIKRCEALWTKVHQAELTIWEAQCAADADTTADAIAAQAAADHAAHEAAVNAAEAEREKNRPVYVPQQPGAVLDITPHPTIPPAALNAVKHITAKPFAWSLFLPHVLSDTAALAITEDAAGKMVQCLTPDGAFVMRPLSESALSKKVKEDKLLTWQEWTLARTAAFEAMRQAGWKSADIAALKSLIEQLDVHELRYMTGGDDILARYMTLARKHWHEKLCNDNTNYDLSIINEKLLFDAEIELKREEEIRTKAELTQARPISSSNLHTQL